MNSPEIRPFAVRDVDEVARLIPQLTKNIVNPEELPSRLMEMTVPVDMPRLGYCYFVAELSTQVVGFGGLAWYPIPSKGVTSWVEELVVNAELRGQGIGDILMARIEAVAVEKKFPQLMLKTGNGSAVRLYERRGFRQKAGEDVFVKYFTYAA